MKRYPHLKRQPSKEHSAFSVLQLRSPETRNRKLCYYRGTYTSVLHSGVGRADWYLEGRVRRKDRQVEDPSEIMQILQKADVCRIAMCDNNVPYIVTMNFGFGRSASGKNGIASLYFHSAGEGKKIDILKKNNHVCFQADIEHEVFLHNISCGCSMKYKSVVGMGRIRFVDDLPEKLEALQAIMAHYTQSSEHVFKEEMVRRTTILRLDVEEISGKALVKPGHLSDQNRTPGAG
jgi:hypothetical protein